MIPTHTLLRFKNHPTYAGWEISRLFFSNGYGASIAKKPDNTYEVATLLGDYLKNELVLNKFATTFSDVEAELERISLLPVDTSKMSRLEANREIIDLIEDYATKYPEQRFGQILYNLGIATHAQESNPVAIPEIQKFIEGPYNEEEITPPRQPLYRDIFFEESTETLKKLRSNES